MTRPGLSCANLRGNSYARALLPSIALALTAMPMVAQQQVAKPALKPASRATPAIIHKTPATLSSVLPAIDSVKRAGVTPGPAAEAFSLNGEAVGCGAADLKSSGGLPWSQVRRGQALFRVSTPTSLAPRPRSAATCPAAMSCIARACPSVASTRSCCSTAAGRRLPPGESELRLRTGRSSDLDRDGSTIGDGSSNDFDAGMSPGVIEIADRNGVDEELQCTHLRRAGPGRRSLLRCRRVQRRHRPQECWGSNKFDDQETTANPIRPENCAPGTAASSENRPAPQVGLAAALIAAPTGLGTAPPELIDQCWCNVPGIAPTCASEYDVLAPGTAAPTGQGAPGS